MTTEVRGEAPPGPLDTYHTERYAEGERVLMHTRAQGALMGSGADGRVAALREVLGQLLQYEQPLRHLLNLMYALDARYDTRTADPHPLAARPRPASAAQVRVVRGLMLVMILCGLLAAGIALGVFLTQGSQVRVVAGVLSARCYPQADLAYPGSVETGCDAAVRFTTAGGRIITTTVTDAFPSEFSGSGRLRTIDLRYDKNDPTQPFKQSNYMPASTFVILLVSGSAVLLSGYWGAARARWLADRAIRNRPGS